MAVYSGSQLYGTLVASLLLELPLASPEIKYALPRNLVET